MNKSDHMVKLLSLLAHLPSTFDDNGDAWLRLADDLSILTGIDPSGSFLRLAIPLGTARRHDDAALALDLLRCNGRHLDATRPCFSIDERDDTVVLSSTMELQGLTADTVSAALSELDAAVRDARARLADAIELSTPH